MPPVYRFPQADAKPDSSAKVPEVLSTFVYNSPVSQTPPPFSPAGPPPRKNRTPLILAIVFVVMVCFCMVPAFFLYRIGAVAVKEGLPMAQCGIAFDDIRKALKAYADEHDGKLPPAETWQDDVRPYYAKIVASHGDDLGPIKPIAADAPWGCTSTSGTTGIAFNSALGGKKLADIENPRSTALIFEIEKPSTNAHEEFKERPRSTSPTIMGEHRDWIVLHIEGETKFDVGKKVGKD